MQNILYFNAIFQGVNIILQLEEDKIINKNFDTAKQSEVLVNSIEQVLNENRLNYNNIDIFTSIIGPGNFTSIKTNLAVLKALQISTKAKIITCSIFDIIGFGLEHDLIILDIGSIKYFIKENNNFFTIHKKDLENFLNDKKHKKIITNDKSINNKDIIYSDFTNQKWINLVNDKAEKELWTNNIEALYIEEAGITQRKN